MTVRSWSVVGLVGGGWQAVGAAVGARAFVAGCLGRLPGLSERRREPPRLNQLHVGQRDLGRAPPPRAWSGCLEGG